MECTKVFRHFYKDKYAELAKEVETPDYLLPLVKGNYLYKGKDIQRSCRKQFADFESVKRAIEALPDEGEVLVKNCGYGERVLLAALAKKNLHIFALQPVEEFRRVAEHCTSRPENLYFIEEQTVKDKYKLVIEEL